jgi:glucose-1-phosphate cytidylyltransferase
MKTVILCGGEGRRLNEETERKPKPLIEIGEKPILYHIMKIYERQNFKEFILCLGYKGNMIKDYFLNLKNNLEDFSLDLKTGKKNILRKDKELEGKIYFVETGLKSMTGARVARVKEYLQSDEDFFLTYGDGLANVNLNKLYDYHKEKNKILTISGVNPLNPFGLMEIEGGLVKTFDEKPRMNEIINGGYMVCNKKIFDYLSEDPSCILEKEPIKKLLEKKEIAVYVHDGFWHCMDTQKHVDTLNEIYNRGKDIPWENIK